MRTRRRRSNWSAADEKAALEYEAKWPLPSDFVPLEAGQRAICSSAWNYRLQKNVVVIELIDGNVGLVKRHIGHLGGIPTTLHHTETRSFLSQRAGDRDLMVVEVPKKRGELQFDVKPKL